MSARPLVRACKYLSRVERAFRSLKAVDLKVRLVCHQTADRGGAHILPCMLAYHVAWHMRRQLAPLLFDDEDVDATVAVRTSVVVPARFSASACGKARQRRSDDGLPGQGFRSLPGDLATVTGNRMVPRLPGSVSFDIPTRPVTLQHGAFLLLGVRLRQCSRQGIARFRTCQMKSTGCVITTLELQLCATCPGLHSERSREDHREHRQEFAGRTGNRRIIAF